MTTTTEKTTVQKRTKNVKLSFTDDEYQKIKNASERAKTKPATLCRERALNLPMKLTKPTKTPQKTAPTDTDNGKIINHKYHNNLAWIGNNINQIAHALNSMAKYMRENRTANANIDFEGTMIYTLLMTAHFVEQ